MSAAVKPDVTAMFEAAISAMATVADLARQGVYAGVIRCPACGGQLHYSVKSIKQNGRSIRSNGQCEERSCLEWIQ